MVINDGRCATNNEPWDVHNNADETAGYMNLVDATANSVNTIFAQLVTRVGPPAVVRMAHRLGIRSPLQPVCSITLGTQAVSPLEMTNAYATLAARGMRHDAQAVESVRTARGGVLKYHQMKPARAVSQAVADKVTYALAGGDDARHGRRRVASAGRSPARPAPPRATSTPGSAATRRSSRRASGSGYPHSEVPMEYVEGYSPVYGGGIPATIWRTFMSGALRNEPVLDFHTPADLYSGSSSGSTYYAGSSSTRRPATRPATRRATRRPRSSGYSSLVVVAPSSSTPAPAAGARTEARAGAEAQAAPPAPKPTPPPPPTPHPPPPPPPPAETTTRLRAAPAAADRRLSATAE